MRKFIVITSIALGHFICCFVLFFQAFGIGMKSFDAPYDPTAFEQVQLFIGRILLSPLAAPLHEFSKGLTKPVMDAPGGSSAPKRVVAVLWFFGPIALNSLLWAVCLWWLSSRLRRFLRNRRVV